MTNEQLTEKYIELDERVAGHREQIKSCFTKLDDLGKLLESVHDLASSVKILANNYQMMDRKVDKIDKRISDIESKPSKRWETALTVVITAVVTAAVTFILSKIGLS